MSLSTISRIALVAIALPTSSFAQETVSNRAAPVPGAVRDGGTFHVATNTWTRKSSGVSLGADVLYDNTCTAGYYHQLDGDKVIDEGGLPSPTTPNTLSTRTGCATSYSIDGFQIGYCTDLTSASFDVAFYNQYQSCTPVVGVVPVGSFSLTGLPGANGSPSFCWTVNVDVSATPFTLDAVQTAPTGSQTFGFSISSPQPGGQHGPIISGDPVTCTRWDGTSWDPTVDLAESGTGMYTDDRFYVESGGSTPTGCYWYGGTVMASYWLELYGDTCAPNGSGQEGFCYPNVGSTLSCPCPMQPAPGAGTGCVHSFGYGARLAGSGTALLSNDTVVLDGTQMPPNSPVLYFQGTLRHNAGTGQVFGDGLRCAGGQIVRLGTATNSASGVSQYPSGGAPSVSVRGGVTAPGTRTYQAWYRNVAAYCTPAGFNTTNGWEIYWGA